VELKLTSRSGEPTHSAFTNAPRDRCSLARMQELRISEVNLRFFQKGGEGLHLPHARGGAEKGDLPKPIRQLCGGCGRLTK